MKSAIEMDFTISTIKERKKVMRTETVTLTNMCMVYDDAGNVLVQDKVDKKWSGLTFPGGHIEKGESFVDSVIREVYEETGLTIEKPRICGTKDWLRVFGADFPGKRRTFPVQCLPGVELKCPYFFSKWVRLPSKPDFGVGFATFSVLGAL